MSWCQVLVPRATTGQVDHFAALGNQQLVGEIHRRADVVGDDSDHGPQLGPLHFVRKADHGMVLPQPADSCLGENHYSL